MVTQTKPKVTRARHTAETLEVAAEISLVKSELPELDVIAGGKVHEIPNSEIRRFYVELTAALKLNHKDSEWLIIANDALNNISSNNHYPTKANAYVNSDTGHTVNVIPWHLDQLNHDRNGFKFALVEMIPHVECAIAARNRGEDDKVGKAYGAGASGRHNEEFTAMADKFFDEFQIENKTIDPATGKLTTKNRANTPLKLNAITQRFVDGFTFDESKFTVELVDTREAGEPPQKSLKMFCEVHSQFVISVPVATQNAKNDDKTAVRMTHRCDVITSKVGTKVDKFCNKVLKVKA